MVIGRTVSSGCIYFFCKSFTFIGVLLCAGTASLAVQWLLVVPVNVRGYGRGIQTYDATVEGENREEEGQAH